MPIANPTPTAADRSPEGVLAEVKQIVASQAGMNADEVGESHTLDYDLSLDSLDKVEITMQLEERFGLEVPDELTEELQTVGDIAERVTQLLNGRSAP